MMESIKKLRELTGAGMMDVKKALSDAGNDEDKAVALLRERGIVKAAKKADREAKEGLVRFVGGIRKMNRLPDAIFVVDPTKEVIAVQEANKLGIPVIALADTVSAPDVIDYIVPGNDDAIRSIQLITHRIGDLMVEARGGG